MDFYTYGWHAALEKLAFGPRDATRVMKAVKPYARHAQDIVGASARSPFLERAQTLSALQEGLVGLPKAQHGTLQSETNNLLAFLRKKGLGEITLAPKGESADRMATALRFHQPKLRHLSSRMSPAQKEMVDSIHAGHELDELLLARHIKPGAQNPFSVHGHVNPRVMLREHSRVATLPTRQNPVRRFQQTLRSTKPPRGLQAYIPNEAELLEQATRGVGGRPGIQYGAQGTRLSRHAQKRVSQRMQELLQKQLPPGADFSP